MDRNDPSYKGQRGYNRFLLAIYDPWVLGFMARAVWRCPIPPVVERYRRLLGRRHLDVGPGTGYFLDKAAPPAGTEITLLDPNPNVLAKASRRLAAMHPAAIEADVMKPLPVDGPFDSAALSFVLHCLRGPQGNKAVAIRNIADVLEPHGVLFGGTVLGLEERRVPRAVVHPRNHDDRNAAQVGVLALRVPELPAGHDRHHQVEQDDVRPASAPQPAERLEAVARALDFVALALEKRRERTQKDGVVFDQQDLTTHGPILLSTGRRGKSRQSKIMGGPAFVQELCLFRSSAGESSSPRLLNDLPVLMLFDAPGPGGRTCRDRGSVPR